MKTVIKGATIPYLQSEEWSFDPSRGWLHHIHYKGASTLFMQNLQQDYARQGIACHLIWHQGDTATLDVEDATLTYTIDTWEVLGNDESRDGFSHPGLLAVATTDQIQQMRQHLQNDDTSTVAFTDSALANLAGGIAQGFYILQELGSTNYRRAQYVLKHTTNAPARYQANIADLNVNSVYSTAKLITEAASAALWIYPIPPRLQYKISNIPVPNAVANYFWGWLKGPTTEHSAPNNRIDLVTEYTLEQWSTIYYPNLVQ